MAGRPLTAAKRQRESEALQKATREQLDPEFWDGDEGNDDWTERKKVGANKLWETAMVAVKRSMILLGSGNDREAQQAALTAAIAIDKCNQVEQAHLRDKAMQLATTKEQAIILGALMQKCLHDLGVPDRATTNVGVILRHYVEQMSMVNESGELRDVNMLLDELQRIPAPKEARAAKQAFKQAMQPAPALPANVIQGEILDAEVFREPVRRAARPWRPAE